MSIAKSFVFFFNEFLPSEHPFGTPLFLLVWKEKSHKNEYFLQMFPNITKENYKIAQNPMLPLDLCEAAFVYKKNSRGYDLKCFHIQ